MNFISKNLDVQNTQYLFVRAIDILAIYIPISPSFQVLSTVGIQFKFRFINNTLPIPLDLILHSVVLFINHSHSITSLCALSIRSNGNILIDSVSEWTNLHKLTYTKSFDDAIGTITWYNGNTHLMFNVNFCVVPLLPLLFCIFHFLCNLEGCIFFNFNFPPPHPRDICFFLDQTG